jgi:hypothetical protein
MPQESISPTRKSPQESRFFTGASKNPSGGNGATALADERQINIGEFYGCLCHQAPRDLRVQSSQAAG